MSDENLAVAIDSWRHSVPSRLERENPFENDGFVARPTTRLTFRAPDDADIEPPCKRRRFDLIRRPTVALFSWSRRQVSSSSTEPLTDVETLPPPRPATALGLHTPHPEKQKQKRTGFLWLLKRKRKHDEIEQDSKELLPREPVLAEPLQLKFLFVGAPESGQTSLLYRARYKYFPDTSVMPRTHYETYTCERRHLNQKVTMELWDTSGTPDLETVELLSYLSWDAIFLCFDTDEKASLDMVVRWWENRGAAIFFSGDNKPSVYLAGLKRDLRPLNAPRRMSVAGYHFPLSLSSLSMAGNAHSQAAWYAKRLGARHVECSAISGEGVFEMLDEAMAEAFRKVVWKEYENW